MIILIIIILVLLIIINIDMKPSLLKLLILIHWAFASWFINYFKSLLFTLFSLCRLFIWTQYLLIYFRLLIIEEDNIFIVLELSFQAFH